MIQTDLKSVKNFKGSPSMYIAFYDINHNMYKNTVYLIDTYYLEQGFMKKYNYKTSTTFPILKSDTGIVFVRLRKLFNKEIALKKSFIEYKSATIIYHIYEDSDY